uniref:2-deoxy-glucose resistant protein 2-like n=1 Tax=Ziziphus jujuba TaxID=326968 RepID=A0A6P4A1F3_ZIZJJ
MGSLSEDEEYRFFDAQEDIASTSDANSDSVSSSSSNNWVSNGLHYDIWMRSPRSVEERRSNFLRWIGLNSDGILIENSVDVDSDISKREFDRIRESSGAVLRTSSFENEFASTRSSISCAENGGCDSSQNLCSKENFFVCRDADSGCGMECDVEEVDEKKSASRKARSLGRLELAGEPENASALSPSFQQLMEKEVQETNNLVGTMKKAKKGWLSKLRSMACIIDKQGDADRLRPNDNDANFGCRAQRVKVRQCGKRSKELSALYMGQDIQAHKGSILTMKFSPDGQYLASAGEDGIVRVWQVVEDERSNELDIPKLDPSCLYFTVNHLSELKPLVTDKEKIGKSVSMRKTSDSACVIFPPKVFRILEKPLHDFCGHSGEVLDLSWSKNNYLLSSSVDKTVRLWRVGYDNCLKIFSHSNYVTCVQFNPMDDNYFISGSIDGKVRIWGIPSCKVVDWTDIREIVTAVCYRPDGEGGIIGSLTGNCRFFYVDDNHLQLDAQISLHNKKKSPCKKITGFQFSPKDSSKVMITCAGSQVRVLDGLNVIGKYRALRNAGNQISAYFTSNGKHIVSACDDSNVYVWNCSNQEETVLSQAKNVTSCERFFSNASVAIPWGGLKRSHSENGSQIHGLDERLSEALPFSSPACFSLSQEFYLESFPKGSATWPEEKLPTSSPLAKTSIMHKSQYKFLKSSCQSTSNSHAWGLVIVTAGWDGRIKSFHNYGLPLHP